ncbi:Lsr2 family protein, partial [Amycolatopsis sp. H6(2020)]|nr:Lsr2 family protein [Amycolatopsis sp. H6(2020)]
QKVKIILEDDLQGGPADETVRFGLDGGQFEIDLTTENASKLRGVRHPVSDSAGEHHGSESEDHSRGRSAGRTGR